MKRYLSFTNLLIFGLAFTAPGHAADGKEISEKFGDLGKTQSISGRRLSILSNPTLDASSAFSNRIVLTKDVTIAAGAFSDYGQVPFDLTGAQDVAISILAPGSDLTGVTILVAWAGFNEFFSVTDVVKGSTFTFKESGGGRVPAYGPVLKILVANDGQAAVTVKQLSVYATVR